MGQESIHVIKILKLPRIGSELPGQLNSKQWRKEDKNINRKPASYIPLLLPACKTGTPQNQCREMSASPLKREKC